MTILVLCREEDLTKERAGYARALRRRKIQIVFAAESFPWNGDLRLLLQRCPERPFLILHPEAEWPLMPWGLADVNIPTACFQIDIYKYTHRRIRWSMLFDYPLLFHSGFERNFRDAGHFGALTLLHAVDASVFSGSPRERILEVSAVGSTTGSNYGTRRVVLSGLAQQFRMNEWWRYHSYEEMAAVYQTSKIVVNVGRDDFPTDVSLRFAEAMAAGAMFVTAIPSELPDLGFEENVHYIGYRHVAQIPNLVRRYLHDEPARQRIAEAGREKVLREHTYDVRVEKWLERIAQDAGKLQAPARHWPEGRVRRIYLDYFAANRALSQAAAELPKIARHSLKDTAIGAAILGRAWTKQIRGKFRSKPKPD